MASQDDDQEVIESSSRRPLKRIKVQRDFTDRAPVVKWFLPVVAQYFSAFYIRRITGKLLVREYQFPHPFTPNPTHKQCHLQEREFMIYNGGILALTCCS